MLYCTHSTDVETEAWYRLVYGGEPGPTLTINKPRAKRTGATGELTSTSCLSFLICQWDIDTTLLEEGLSGCHMQNAGQ